MLEPAPAVRKTQPVLAPPGALKCEPGEHSSTHPCRDLGLLGIVFASRMQCYWIASHLPARKRAQAWAQHKR